MMRVSTVLRSALVAALATGCFAVVDVDRFKQGTTSQFQDLRFRLEQATSHTANYCEYRIVDPAGTIRSRGIIDPLFKPDVDVHAPNAVPTQGGPYRIDFYCDKVQLRAYNGLGPDHNSAHAWQVSPLADYPPPGNPNDNLVDVRYVHDTNFKELNETPSKNLGFAFKMKMTKMDAYIGKLVQVRVSDVGSGQTLGVYRFPSLPKADPDLVIPGIVLDLSYRIDVYADVNGNGVYDNPATGGDHGWRLQLDGTGADLSVNFDPDSAPKNVDVGLP